MQFASMSLGIFDFLIDWLTKFMIWLIGWVFDLINALFARLFFNIGTSILTIADNIQVVFKRLCGMDVYWVIKDDTTTKVEGVDPLAQLFTDSQVMQALIALTLVAVAMVIIATIVQIIRTEFSTEGSKNTKGNIIGQSLKAMLLFALVPLCCIGGVFICNRLLVAVDRATNLSKGNSTVGSTIFIGAASSANKVRNGSNLTPLLLKGVGVKDTVDQNNRERIAQAVDSAFRDNTLGTSTGFGEVLRDIGQELLGQYSYEQIKIVELYYDILNINYITYIGGGLLATYTLLCVCFGMIMRLYKGIVLFIISPPMVGLMPIDNGSAFKQWRQAFIGQMLSAYGTVVGMNLLFLILPIISNIKLFTPLKVGAQDFNGLNSFMQVLFTLTGLFMLKDIGGMISKMIGADDAAASGEGMAKKVGSTAVKIGSVAAGGAGIAMKGAGVLMAKNAASKGVTSKWANTFGGLGNKMTQRAKGTLGSAFNKAAGFVTGGEIKPFSEEKDFDKAQETRQKKKEAREKRIKEGAGTWGDGIVSKISESEFGKAWNDYSTGGVGVNTSEKATREGKKAVDTGLAAETDKYGKIKELTSTDDGSLLSKLEKALQKAATGASPMEKLQGADEANNIIETIKNQGETFEEMKDLLIKLNTIQSGLNSASSGTAKGRYAASVLDGTSIRGVTSNDLDVYDANGNATGAKTSYVSNLNTAVTNNISSIQSGQQTVQSGKTVKEEDLRAATDQISSLLQKVSKDGRLVSLSAEEQTKESKRLLESLQSEISKIKSKLDDKK